MTTFDSIDGAIIAYPKDDAYIKQFEGMDAAQIKKQLERDAKATLNALTDDELKRIIATAINSVTANYISATQTQITLLESQYIEIYRVITELVILTDILPAQVAAATEYSIDNKFLKALAADRARELYPEPITWRNLKQNNVTNTLATIKPNKRNTEIDRITGTITITAPTKDGTITVQPDTRNISSIADALKYLPLKTSTHKLLDALLLELTDAGMSSAKVKLPLRKFMSDCGRKDIKGMRETVNQDLSVLYDISINCKGNTKGKTVNYDDLRIISKKGIKNSVIEVTFGVDFIDSLKDAPIMPHTTAALKFDDKKNPYSYILMRKLEEHRYMNRKKKNYNIIGVKSLLAVCADMPTYAEVMATDRALSRRIIEPFMRDLDALHDVVKCHLCHRRGEPLTDSELANMDYKLFESLMVFCDWVDYPIPYEPPKPKKPRKARKKKAD